MPQTQRIEYKSGRLNAYRYYNPFCSHDNILYFNFNKKTLSRPIFQITLYRRDCKGCRLNQTVHLESKTIKPQ